MKRTSWIFWTCLLTAGCGELPAPSETVFAEAELPHHAELTITEKSLDEPLTDDEVLAFIELVQSFPSGKPPEFGPVPGWEGAAGLSPEESVEAWRKAVREALTVDTLIQGWAPRSQVRQALNERQVTSRALISLMLRMSCALAADAMGGSRMVAAQRVIADEKVESLVARMHQYQRSRAKPPESLEQALEEAASLAEYLALLASVPIESQQSVMKHRTELLAILPLGTPATATPQSHEDQHLMPIHFEESARDVKRRSR